MSWNDGYERNKFEQEQKAQEKVYRKCGMSDEQIREMYLLDLLEYRNNRNYAMHIQSIEELESNGEEWIIYLILSSSPNVNAGMSRASTISTIRINTTVRILD